MTWIDDQVSFPGPKHGAVGPQEEDLLILRLAGKSLRELREGKKLGATVPQELWGLQHHSCFWSFPDLANHV